MALHTIEICAGVGMLGEGLRAGLQHMGVSLRTVCYVEREAYPCSVLAARMQEGSLDDAPIWTDLLTFDAAAWHGAVDCIVAGFPCQDLSLAGRRAGLDGARSGLFFDILDIADDSGAWCLFLENVSGIASATASVVDEAEGELEERAAARVMGELADRGWHAEWLTLSASDVGASHGRARWFCFAWRMADTNLNRAPERQEEQRCDGTRIEPLRSTGNGGDASTNVDDAQRAQRGQACTARTGGQQGDDGGRSEAHGGVGEPIEVLGAAAQFGWREGRPESGRKQGRPDATEHGGAVADAGCQRRQQERGGSLGDEGAHEGRTSEHDHQPAGFSASMADASSPGRQGREQRRTLHGHRGGQEAHGPTEQFRRPFFAPGPADPRWRDILQQCPELAPALEPDFRGMVDGMAFAMDESRAQRLKCIGNGVVPICAAAAAVVLIKRQRLI